MFIHYAAPLLLGLMGSASCMKPESLNIERRYSCRAMLKFEPVAPPVTGGIYQINKSSLILLFTFYCLQFYCLHFTPTVSLLTVLLFIVLFLTVLLFTVLLFTVLLVTVLLLTVLLLTVLLFTVLLLTVLLFTVLLLTVLLFTVLLLSVLLLTVIMICHMISQLNSPNIYQLHIIPLHFNYFGLLCYRFKPHSFL